MCKIASQWRCDLVLSLFYVLTALTRVRSLGDDSSVLPGFNTASRMLEEREIEDEDGSDETGESIYPLKDEATEILGRLRDHLRRQLQTEGDPKFDRVLEVLRSDFERASRLQLYGSLAPSMYRAVLPSPPH